MKVLITKLDKELPTPRYAKPGDAGVDVYSAIDCVLAPGERALIPTGIAIAMPNDYAAFAHPRSGLAIKNGISILNSPGTIDAGYRGEIQMILINHDPKESFTIKRGDRIAQLVFQKIETVDFIEVEELPGSGRGTGGFGSTGKS